MNWEALGAIAETLGRDRGEVSGYRLRLASIWFTRPSTHRRTNSDKDKFIPFAQRLALASKEAGTFVVSVLVGFLAIDSK